MLACRYSALFLVLATAGIAGCSDDDDSTGGGSLDQDGGSDSGAEEGGGGTPDKDPLPEDVTLPIIFLHGFVGSAQQYESQALRFAANGYPLDRIRAVEHVGDQSLDSAALMVEVDALADELIDEYDSGQFYLVGHSRGTAMSNLYMGDPDRAAKVAKYISLDGGGCGVATSQGIDCIDPHQNRPMDDNEFGIPGQAHVEISTSAESFKMQYEFLVGEEPEVVDIVRQANTVTISGRAVDFPSNAGRDGTTLDIWELDPDTGERVGDDPVETYEIDETGNFGPLDVSSHKRYEMALLTPDTGTQHFYLQQFLRNSNFVRLLSGDPETSFTRMNTVVGDKHAAIIAMRMREWYGTDDADFDGDQTDVLEISTKSESGDQDPVNAIQPYMRTGAIALHIHDAVTPEESTLEELPNFAGQPFQTSVDVFMPAAEPPDGTITITNYPRGNEDNPQTFNIPNWISDGHFITLMFSDSPQE